MSPAAKLVTLEAETLSCLHPAAARSVFWELDPLSESYQGIDSEMDKSAWLLALVYEQKTAGFSIVTDRARATLLMCPPSAAPGAVRLPTAPFSADAYCLTSLHVDAAFAGIGWEALLIDAATAHLTQLPLPAIEAFGLKDDYSHDLTGICKTIVENAEQIGLMPVSALESAGFSIVADHPVIPRLRLDLPPEQGLLSEREIAELLAQVPT